MSKRLKIEETLKDLIIDSKDLSEFQSYSLRNELCGILGKYFNSIENRKFIIEQTSPIVKDKQSGAEVIQLKPEHFRAIHNKNVNPEVVEEIKEVATSVSVNEDKELANMNTRELKKYFGDINLALEHLNGERLSLGLPLIDYKEDLQWNDIKEYVRENIGENLKKVHLESEIG